MASQIEQRRKSLGGQIAQNTRWGHHEKAQEARRELHFLNAEEYIKNLVDSFPPLTPEQRDRLADLLRGA
ncbi:hypothetical protein [Jiangella asiatica]|uniref:Uncharacterized protein n=1 Tax=Jiangella asiatica TaxID=2530372 RepID=A0A4R5CGS2_9ACTN|nr:hypothetical protein [Jiangella asiatica]TDD98905.1 hypothetical protein E1269_28285 [Jiangella asiatica]